MCLVQSLERRCREEQALPNVQHRAWLQVMCTAVGPVKSHRASLCPWFRKQHPKSLIRNGTLLGRGAQKVFDALLSLAFKSTVLAASSLADRQL